MEPNNDEKFLYELFGNGSDIPGYYRLKRCLTDFGQVKAEVHSVLDAGCGGGTKSIYLAINHPPLTVVGTDINEASVRNAEDLKNRYHITNASFSQKDLVHCRDLGTFDFTIVSDVLEHIENDTQVAINIDAMVKPGGYVHINVPAKDHDYDFSKLGHAAQEDLHRWMKDMGHVRLGYTCDEIKALFPNYDVVRMHKVGNCCYKIAYFFWEKAVFDPSRKQQDKAGKEYILPFIDCLDLLMNRYLIKRQPPFTPQAPPVNMRIFLQAIRTIDLGIDLEERGMLDKRYLIEEEVCCLLRKPVRP